MRCHAGYRNRFTTTVCEARIGRSHLNLPSDRMSRGIRRMSTGRNLVLYVDVDDTLVRSFGSKQIPIPNVIRRVRGLATQPGVVAYCWSSGGAEYAREVAAKLGLEDCFAGFLPKPNILIDDLPVGAWRDLLTLHPNVIDDQDVAALRRALGWSL